MCDAMEQFMVGCIRIPRYLRNIPASLTQREAVEAPVE
jgi:hypothetical protein